MDLPHLGHGTENETIDFIMELQQENTQASTDLQPQKAILQMVSGYWVTQALYVAARLGIADLLKDGSDMLWFG